MSDNATNVLQKAQDLNISPKFAPYMGVRILTGQQDDDGNDIVYESGDMTGRVLEISNEWGTQEQADNIAASISGWAYQPFDAGAALLDPAAELNDGITVNGVYSGICTKATAFGRLMAADVSAPQDEEINHEYAFVSATERTYTRQIKETKSELKIQASQIAAKVSSSGGKASSFGWVLTDTDWSLYSGDQLVLQADRQGLMVAGLIKAREFQTLDGNTLATQAELNAIRQYSGGSYGSGGSSGFVAAMAAAQGFNLATSGSPSTVPEYFSAEIMTVKTSLGVNGPISCKKLVIEGYKLIREYGNLTFTGSGTVSLGTGSSYEVKCTDGVVRTITVPSTTGSVSVSGHTQNFNYMSYEENV